MTVDEFVAKYTNKFVEYHSYGTGALYQCVDLANQYITEVLGLPAIIGTNAQDFPSKAGSNYSWIVNTPAGVPLKGDIIIFRSADNIGHISIYVEGGTSLFTSFDQNYPIGSPCKLVSHNYRNVIGWLHPKQKPMSDTITIEKKVFENLVTKSTKYDEFVSIGYEDVNKVTKKVSNLENDLESEKVSKEQAQKELVSANNARTEADKRVKTLERELESVRLVLDESTSVNNDLIKQLQDCKTQNNQVNNLEEPILTKITDWIKKILAKL
jgi:low affinity Fe/Cu permease